MQVEIDIDEEDIINEISTKKLFKNILKREKHNINKFLNDFKIDTTLEIEDKINYHKESEDILEVFNILNNEELTLFFNDLSWKMNDFQRKLFLEELKKYSSN